MIWDVCLGRKTRPAHTATSAAATRVAATCVTPLLKPTQSADGAYYGHAGVATLCVSRAQRSRRRRRDHSDYGHGSLTPPTCSDGRNEAAATLAPCRI